MLFPFSTAITITINNTNILNGRIVYEGELNLNFIFSTDANTRIDTKKYTLSFTFNIDYEQISSNKVVNTRINPVDDEFVITSDGMIECKVNLEFETEMYNNANINIIDEINMEEDKNEMNSSMIIYIVKEGDTLWNIAKRYKTTMEDLISLNNLENANNLSIGQKLFIPRYCMNKIA